MSGPEADEGVPATPETPITTEEDDIAPEAPIPFKQYLDTVHPSVSKEVIDLWEYSHSYSGVRDMLKPELRLHCERCDGERTFRSSDNTPQVRAGGANLRFISYMCGDCLKHVKSFSLWIVLGETEGVGGVYKYGEHPPFGIPVPKKVLRLFGNDRTNFLKGRQCENQGLGVGAFAYYRRVVENHKDEIFDEIIKVCQTVGAPQELIEELRSAKKENSFTKAMEQIKTALPQGLMITGQDPLVALHGALSVGLHNESDEECLETAHAVRLVLTDLIEKMSLLRQDNKELHGAVRLLVAKKGGA